MAPVIGRAAIAISAVIRTAAVIDRAAAIVPIRIAIIGAAVLGRSDRKAGPDNTGESCCCGSATAAPIEPAASAEVSGVAGRGRRQAFARWGGPGERQRWLYRCYRHRRNCRHHGGAAVARKHAFLHEHLNVLLGNPPW